MATPVTSFQAGKRPCAVPAMISGGGVGRAGEEVCSLICTDRKRCACLGGLKRFLMRSRRRVG